MKFIYGVIAFREELSLGPIGVGREEVFSFNQEDLALVISPWRGEAMKDLPLRESLLALMEYQRVLEAVLELCPVLPVKFGTILPQSSLGPLLQQGAEAFTLAMKRFQGKVQYELTGFWDLLFLLGEREKEGGDIESFLETRRQRLKEAVLSRLAPMDWVENPLLDESLALSLNLLVGRETELHPELEGIEKEYRARFRLTGPMPPYSFCTIHIEEIPPSSFLIRFCRQGE